MATAEDKVKKTGGLKTNGRNDEQASVRHFKTLLYKPFAKLEIGLRTLSYDLFIF
jgi:hypothetical protein